MSDSIAQRPSARAAPVGWLRRWWQSILLDPGLLVVIVVIGCALVGFVLRSEGLPLWRYLGAAALLALLLALNLRGAAPSDDAAQPVIWRFLALSTALFLLACLVSNVGSFIPMIALLLMGQSIWALPLRQALAFSAALMLAVVGLIGAVHGGAMSVEALIGLTPGAIFTLVFALLTLRHDQQRRRAEGLLAQLQATNAELAAAREREKELAVAEERVRLARDIHDGLGHHLTVLHVQLQAAEKLLGRDQERAARAIAVSRSEAQAALDEVRRSVAALRHTPLDGRGLDVALGDLVRCFGQNTGLEAELSLAGDSRSLAPPAALLLYRAAQEGLTNIQKHAAARRASVALRYETDGVRLAVCNDGAATGPGIAGGGFGLWGLQERASQLGGAVRAGPLAEGGFLLEVVVPQ